MNSLVLQVLYWQNILLYILAFFYKNEKLYFVIKPLIDLYCYL